jgi:hypothetical protein
MDPGIALGLLGLGFAVFASFAIYEWRKKSKLRRRTGMVLGVVLALSGGATLLFDKPKAAAATLPDVTLRLVQPKAPGLVLVNLSGTVARDIKYSFALYDIDKRHEYLPIPTTTFDFIRPHESGGPEDLFGRIASNLSRGDRISGSISVTCPDCVTLAPFGSI